MATQNIEVKGLDELIAGLDSFSTMIVERRMTSAMTRVFDYINTQVEVYAPIPYGSTYERTFRMQRGWGAATRVTNITNGFNFSAQETNEELYSGFLQDRDILKNMAHKPKKYARRGKERFLLESEFPTNWLGFTAQDVLEKQEVLDTLARILEMEVQAAIDEAGYS